jgi:dienelactone hydrolase
MLMRSAGLTSLLLALLAGACGEAAIPEPPLVGPIDGCTFPTLSDAPAPASALTTFEYDRAAAYDPVLQPIGTDQGVQVYALSFLSTRGNGRATGRLFMPGGAGPFAGMLLQHGMPGNAAQMTGTGVVLARHGAVVVALDAPFAQRGGSPIRFTETDSAEQVQLMTDLRRALDLLVARPDVDSSRLGYMGISYGGAMGALFVGIEHRLKTGILVVGDGGLVTHLTGPEDAGAFAGLSCTERRRWLESMIPIEPVKFVGFAPPTSLLLQSGTLDDLVPPRDAERLHAAARDPKTIRWYNAGHNLNTEAAHDRQVWLQQRLGMSALDF